MRLYDGPKTARCTPIVEGEVGGWRVSRTDVAAFALAQMSSREFVGKAPIVVETPRWIRAARALDQVMREP